MGCIISKVQEYFHNNKQSTVYVNYDPLANELNEFSLDFHQLHMLRPDVCKMCESSNHKMKPNFLFCENCQNKYDIYK